MKKFLILGLSGLLFLCLGCEQLEETEPVARFVSARTSDCTSDYVLGRHDHPSDYLTSYSGGGGSGVVHGAKVTQPGTYTLSVTRWDGSHYGHVIDELQAGGQLGVARHEEQAQYAAPNGSPNSWNGYGYYTTTISGPGRCPVTWKTIWLEMAHCQRSTPFINIKREDGNFRFQVYGRGTIYTRKDNGSWDFYGHSAGFVQGEKAYPENGSLQNYEVKLVNPHGTPQEGIVLWPDGHVTPSTSRSWGDNAPFSKYPEQ